MEDEDQDENQTNQVEPVAPVKSGRGGYRPGAGKKKGTAQRSWMDKVRNRIRAAAVETTIIKHLNGEQELTPTQVKAAEILLKKIMPDLSSIEGEVTHELEGLDPREIAIQVAGILTANPQLLADVLMMDANARAAVEGVLRSLPPVATELKH